MKLQTLELKNYKSHKAFKADFRGENAVVSGSKGSGKTSLKDAFTWLITGALVDDPTPVDSTGEIINNQVISAEATFDDGTILKIESKQKFKKDGSISQNHSFTCFVNETPCQLQEYQAFLEEKLGTLEQRRILLDPSWFATGDGLKVGGKTTKTATQRRREIVISVAGAENMEKSIAENEENAKRAKFAIGQLKKELDDAHAGIESLHDAKIDTSELDINLINEGIQQLEAEKIATAKSMEALASGNDAYNTLNRALSDAQTALSQARAKYSQEYQSRLEATQKPYREYLNQRQTLQNQLQQARHAYQQQETETSRLINEIERLEEERNVLLKTYMEEKNNQYIPNSTICQTCGQSLPADRLLEAEARFNKHKSDAMEKNVAEGTRVKGLLEEKRKLLQQPKKDFGIEQLETQLAQLEEPIQETIPTFEETTEYATLTNAILKAQQNLTINDDSEAKALYQRTLDSLGERISKQRALLEDFRTNEHLDSKIEQKALELQEISARSDEQKQLLEQCNEFTRKTLSALEKSIEETFHGIRFKMFEYTLDGSQKDTCITYAKTPNGYIPWESLSGGQKRSATISLANAFTKAWGVELPLWVDDTQIYQEDEQSSSTQLIRITEKPHEKLEVK